MNTFMKWLSESFAPTMRRVFSKPWLSAVASCMQKIIPFILTGSVIYVYNVVRSFAPSLPDLSPIANFSFGVISLLVAFEMAHQCMEKLNHPFYFTNAGLGAICVMLMIVTPTDKTVEGGLATLISGIGASGIAIGMIAGLFTSLVFHLWGKLKFLEESSVPDFVTGWINTIIPMLICLGVTMGLVYGLGINVVDVILSVFRPITGIAQTLPGFILICFVPAFFYTCGISSWMFNAITTPIFLAGIQANIEAVAAGLPATNIVTNEAVFTLAFITMGGRCATLVLNVLMCLSKCKKLKTVGKIFLVPSIFNINEPIMYSSVVFNPLLMLPAWINSIVGPIYVWFLMSSGLLNIPSKLLQVGQIPAPFSSVLITEDFRAILWWVLLFGIYLVIWYPFFKTWEREQIQQESDAGAIAEAA